MPVPGAKPSKRVTKKATTTKPKTPRTRTPRKPKAGEPTQQQIAEAAYYLWQEKGRPIGQDKEHWQEAETRLRGATPRRKTTRKKKL